MDDDRAGIKADAQAFLNYCLDQNRSRKTVATYKQVLEDFSVWLSQNAVGVHGVGELQRAHVQGYSRSLRLRDVARGRGTTAELSPRTRAKYLATVRSLLKYFAVE